MTPTNELHVVFGTGPVGQSVVQTLLAQGKPTRVVSRGGARRSLPPEVEIVRGDATNPEDTTRACLGATHVYNCTNPTDYHRWPELFPPLQRGVLAGAAAVGAKLIVMENLYMYGPHGGIPMTETMTMNGKGSRSSTRRMLTEELFAAYRSGQVRATSVRASDLFGPNVVESLVGRRFFEPLLARKKVQMFADLDMPHSFSYIHDVGRALVAAGTNDAAMGRAWHAPNAPPLTLREFATLAGQEAGVVPKLSATPRGLFRALLPLLGLAIPPIRGLSENLYIFYEPYIVDHSAYTHAFGGAATPIKDAIGATVQWYRSADAQRVGAHS